MDRNQLEQEKEIREMLRRADRHADRSGNLRRETLRKLIELAHSPSPSVKSLVASNIKTYIADFPDLEDDAINAVYDLCEDPISKIRIEGYHAIVQVSRMQRQWIKRNADVLVQLLQSDEPAEVVVVKKALLEHLDMDPQVTLGVLCDQITPHDEPMDEEEKAIRERLRSLVLAFITGEARRSILERHVSDVHCEGILADGLSQAIAKLPYSDVDLIVRNILLALPSYRSYSSRGDKLLQTILARARSTLAQDLRPAAHPLSLPSTRPYLALAALVSLERRAGHPLHIVRFFCSTLINRMAFSRLDQETQLIVIHSLAEALEVVTSDVKNFNHALSEELLSVHNQAVDASVVPFEWLAESMSRGADAWDDCRKLLLAALQRHRENAWSPPIPMAAALRKILGAAQFQENRSEHSQVIQDLIRSLLSTAAKPPLAQSASNTNVLEGKGSTDNSTPATLKRKIDQRDDSLPPRPAPVAPLIQRQTGGTSSRAAEAMRKTLSTPNGESRAGETSSYLNKKTRMDSANGSRPTTPSLLSRLNGSMTPPVLGLPPKPELQIRGRGREEQRLPSPELNKAPVGGYSIKGAAKATNQRNDEETSNARTSLLDRLSGSSDALAGRIEGDFGSRRKKKKGKGV
ncbi:hypothetical protein NEOLEDRAFT_1128637 [Neolentinus lepideus HHB14362 ss-1]|uniref:ARM repeat-containing protein n=1 Tax=Neolentinus lepideus HHB14362 ss-1 TaxID=1314782 RepID=A0A165V3A5_9AGAM|nr:hypothetical protein NEOLEDRAFT_1128637 [Neolentinus lepideus HHB14362 ss-1]